MKSPYCTYNYMTSKVSFADETSTGVDDLAILCGKGFRKIDERFDQTDEKIEAAGQRLQSQISDIRSIMVTRPEFDAMYRGMIARFDGMDARFDRLEDKMDRKFDDVLARIDSVLITLKRHDDDIEMLKKDQQKLP